MTYYKLVNTFLRSFAFIAFVLLFSCNNETPENKTPQADTVTFQANKASQDNSSTPQFPKMSSGNIEAKTFEVKDSTGTSKGWGYDIYVDGKKAIHQPIIPAIPGNNAFKTEKDAQKTGMLAADKMKKTGSLPTLSVKELDSLGVTKK